MIGATGLVATAWSWTWERYGAPQVSHRFKKRAGRDMGAEDWAAWLAVRALDDARARKPCRRQRGRRTNICSARR